ncbi:MAG: hypothetical protein NTV01_05025, partial [Bacteroidia bacterium]|nr:hypothetical protein [Bacteroidia bacterium]
MKKLFWIGLVVILIASCYHDNEEFLYPKLDQGCDTTLITFSKSILPILQTNCYGCHSASENANSGKGINLEDFSLLKQRVISGEFYASIVQNSTLVQMPKDGAVLATCSLNKIKIW